MTAPAAPRGTKDILPAEVGRWQQVEAEARAWLANFQCREVRTPIFESTELFERGVGEGTDVVGKEMYSFEDRGQRSLTLRPEGTAGVARAYIEHKLHGAGGPLRLWYLGPMFRYERPAAGRQRQFHQLGVEWLNEASARADAEAIAAGWGLLERLGIPGLKAHINSVGCEDPVCRPAHRQALEAHLRAHAASLCADCLARTERNPLRALDCKVPSCRPVMEAAPALDAFWCEACRAHQSEVESLLGAAGLPFWRDPRLVRGLDYYRRTVFELVSSHPQLGAQGTVLAGGRYDHLVSELGGPATPSVGWALGMERLVFLLPEGLTDAALAEVVLMAAPGGAATKAFALAQAGRKAGVAVAIAPPGKLGAQFKFAERMGASFAAILGESELAAGELAIKNLSTREQLTIQGDEAGFLAWLAARAEGA